METNFNSLKGDVYTKFPNQKFMVEVEYKVMLHQATSQITVLVNLRS